MSHDSIVFDLDGTLWDTCEPCAIAWNNVLRAEGIPYRTIVAEDVRVVTGRPHEECIRRTFTDLSEEQIQRISDATMVEDNRVIAEVGGVLYPGVRDGLFRLRERYQLFIVSNCQSGYIETFLRLNELEELFSDIECWGNTGNPKGDNLRDLMARNDLTSPMMIGDAEGDETAARQCGVPYGFVEYGFGTCTAPDYRFASFADLCAHFLG
ncbi:MAG: HAD family hydrolase [Armatimonadetes bacterium]|nr:HAD family hydrolase [Armatimonadota bacterium]MBS1726579.1 HAD family hydrolase [Armatimonadota bacterium]